jgi:hypothetical protein
MLCDNWKEQKEADMLTFAPLLLSPMMLTSEPVVLQPPDSSYDHQSQASTFKGRLSNIIKASLNYTNTQTFGSSSSDTDGDSNTD